MQLGIGEEIRQLGGNNFMEFQIHIDQVITLFGAKELAFMGRFLIGAILSLIFGYIIGWERMKHEKPAGIVTHSFVILGSMLFTMLSLLDDVNPTRIAANILTGIGFLGAGMIMRGDNKVENLTTAAGIWISSAVGMALGFQMYAVAILTVAMMFFARFLPGARH